METIVVDDAPGLADADGAGTAASRLTATGAASSNLEKRNVTCFLSVRES
ncbi:hypothetical protein [Micromonospora sp. 4G55]|nr:hypothetical protein [Micromonospora sp. 4G55]MBM0257625.1 hypothetical protein [Micromonospora sp. 4G55]